MKDSAGLLRHPSSGASKTRIRGLALLFWRSARGAALLTALVPAVSAASAGKIFLMCDVVGRGQGWGPMYQNTRHIEQINMQVLVTITSGSGTPIYATIYPQCKSEDQGLINGRFSCNHIYPLDAANDFKVFDTQIIISNRFTRDISIWEQRVAINRITLGLQVNTSRRYVNPPDEGWSVSYEGPCRLEPKRF
jgi:hypothetical protein